MTSFALKTRQAANAFARAGRLRSSWLLVHRRKKSAVYTTSGFAVVFRRLLGTTWKRGYQPDGHGLHPAVVMAHEFAGVKGGGRSRSASGAKGSLPLLSITAIGAARVASLAK